MIRRPLLLAAAVVGLAACGTSTVTATSDPLVARARRAAPHVTDGFADAEIRARLSDVCTLVITGWRISDFLALPHEGESPEEIGQFLRVAVDANCPDLVDEMVEEA